jgi:hypothetical protein
LIGTKNTDPHDNHQKTTKSHPSSFEFKNQNMLTPKNNTILSTKKPMPNKSAAGP